MSADRIAIRGLRVRGNHGVFDFERRDGQDFVIDAVLEVDTTAAAATDDVNETLDYGKVVASIVAVVAGPAVNLIETLAAQIVDSCLSFPLVQSVEVTVHKPDAPVPAEFDDVSVTIVRRRDNSSRP